MRGDDRGGGGGGGDDDDRDVDDDSFLMNGLDADFLEGLIEEYIEEEVPISDDEEDYGNDHSGGDTDDDDEEEEEEQQHAKHRKDRHRRRQSSSSSGQGRQRSPNEKSRRQQKRRVSRSRSSSRSPSSSQRSILSTSSQDDERGGCSSRKGRRPSSNAAVVKNSNSHRSDRSNTDNPRRRSSSIGKKSSRSRSRPRPSSHDDNVDDQHILRTPTGSSSSSRYRTKGSRSPTSPLSPSAVSESSSSSSLSRRNRASSKNSKKADGRKSKTKKPSNSSGKKKKLSTKTRKEKTDKGIWDLRLRFQEEFPNDQLPSDAVLKSLYNITKTEEIERRQRFQEEYPDDPVPSDEVLKRLYNIQDNESEKAKLTSSSGPSSPSPSPSPLSPSPRSKPTKDQLKKPKIVDPSKVTMERQDSGLTFATEREWKQWQSKRKGFSDDFGIDDFGNPIRNNSMGGIAEEEEHETDDGFIFDKREEKAKQFINAMSQSVRMDRSVGNFEALTANSGHIKQRKPNKSLATLGIGSNPGSKRRSSASVGSYRSEGVGSGRSNIHSRLVVKQPKRQDSLTQSMHNGKPLGSVARSRSDDLSHLFTMNSNFTSNFTNRNSKEATGNAVLSSSIDLLAFPSDHFRKGQKNDNDASEQTTKEVLGRINSLFNAVDERGGTDSFDPFDTNTDAFESPVVKEKPPPSEHFLKSGFDEEPFDNSFGSFGPNNDDNVKSKMKKRTKKTKKKSNNSEDSLTAKKLSESTKPKKSSSSSKGAKKPSSTKPKRNQSEPSVGVGGSSGFDFETPPAFTMRNTKSVTTRSTVADSDDSDVEDHDGDYLEAPKQYSTRTSTSSTGRQKRSSSRGRRTSSSAANLGRPNNRNNNMSVRSHNNNNNNSFSSGWMADMPGHVRHCQAPQEGNNDDDGDGFNLEVQQGTEPVSPLTVATRKAIRPIVSRRRFQLD